MMKLTLTVLFLLVAVVCSFTFSPRGLLVYYFLRLHIIFTLNLAATRPAKLTMLFNFGGKKAAPTEYKVGEGTAVCD